MQKPRLLLVDGNNLLHRSYHALPPLTVHRTGEMVNAVYGFTTMLIKAINEHKPDYYAIAFDRKAPTFRHQLSEEYKATRQKAPEDLIPQLEKAREIARGFNIAAYELDGYEADDIIGTLARQASMQGIETLILTGDADSMQLVGPGVRVLYPKPGKAFSDTALFDEAAVAEKYGIEPRYVADYKALVGDPSDNIKGVNGIGPKTAVNLIQQFGGIDNIYAHLEEVTPVRVRELLRQGEASARQSKILATIVTDVPVTLDLKSMQAGAYDHNQIVDMLRDLEFFTLINRLPQGKTFEAPMPSEKGSDAAETHAFIKKEPVVVNTPEAMDSMLLELKSAGSAAIELLIDGDNPMTAQLVGLSLASTGGRAYYIPVSHMSLDAGRQLGLDEIRSKLNPLLSDASLTRQAHNANLAMTVLAANSFTAGNFKFDTMLAAHLLGDTSLELQSLALKYLGVEVPKLAAGKGTRQPPVSHLDVAAAASCLTAAANAIGFLSPGLEAGLKKEGLWQLFSDVEIPLIPVLVRMQENGVLLDVQLLQEMSGRLGARLQAIEGEIYRNVGHQFNINSPKQLGSVLFEELHLPAQKKKGSWSTDASVLEALKGTHPVVDCILEYRQLSKLKSTYVDALPLLVNRRTGRLHTSFNQMRTATGRLSSSDPNLQNIPVRGDLGREIRRAFIASEGSWLLSGDYSQIDLRSLAHLSQDPLLMATFELGADVHTATAVQLFGVEPSRVTADMRRLAKTVNFGVIYGMSGYGLEQATELSRKDAESFIQAYFEKHPGVKAYLEATKQQARDRGYVETVLGRRRAIPEINSPNRIIREAAERMAINMPVQGTSADIIKMAMLKLDTAMRQRHLQSKLILQVHDELIFEVPQNELEIMRQIVPEIMSQALTLSVPVTVDVKTGRTWGEME